MPDLVARAEILIRVLGRLVMVDPAEGMAPAELAGCVVRALNLPEVAALRPRLAPEFAVYAAADMGAARRGGGRHRRRHRLRTPDGAPEVVIDWKSDVDPAPETVEHYRAQLRTYLEMTGADRGLIVSLTSGSIVHVERTA